MNKMILVLKNELRNTILRRSYLLTLFLLPLGSFIVIMIIAALQRSDASQQMISNLLSPAPKVSLEGYIDQSGVIKLLPKGLEDKLQPFASEADARRALDEGVIAAFYLIPPDYLENGEVIYTRPDFNPLGGLSQTQTIGQVLTYNLANGDMNLVDRVQTPMRTEVVTTTEQPQRNPDDMLTFFLPYGVTLLFYIVILSSASLMLNSVTIEKQNRVMEILMTSITPTQMLTGKIIALGIAGLLQTVVWSGAGFGLLRLSGQTFSLPAAFQLPWTILVWGIVFFLGGYALYASLMAGLGALVPNLREASQATTVVILPMIVPLMLISALISDPNGTLSVVLSIIPLTSPVSMMTRLAAANVPLWQILLSVVLLLATVLLVIRSVAGMFQAQNLLSGKSFNVKIFLKALFGRYTP